MKNPTSKGNRANRSLPAIMAVGGSIAAMPASALELGELTLQSHLGQPLRASIAYALGPNEELADNCVTMRRGPSVSGLPTVGAASVNVSNGVIFLSGTTPVREPMISAHVVVNCPYAPNLSREYLVFVDPAIPAYEQSAAAPPAMRQPEEQPVVEPIQDAVVRTQPVANSQANAVQARPAPTPARQAPAQRSVRPAPDPIAAVDTYQVQPGDSLSEIVARIDDRSLGLWAAVDAVFVANPDAFIDNDPNKLKAGSVLSIPDLGGSVARVAPAASVPAIAATTAEPVPADTMSAETTVESGYDVSPPAAAEPLAAADPIFADEVVDDSAASEELLGDTGTASAASSDLILDADIEAPLTTSQSPSQSTQIISTTSADNDGGATPTWLLWLAGSGVALIFALLMFGRRFRREPEFAPAAPKAEMPHERHVIESEDAIAVEEVTPAVASSESADAEPTETDEAPTVENLKLDAQVIAESGLDDTAPNDVSDFSYDSSADVDFELPFEPQPTVKPDTAILPTLKTDEITILESEILPEDDDEEMSIVLDDTSDVPSLEEATAQIESAQAVVDNDATMLEDSQIDDMALKTLAQDYEDEFTATQAMNAEMAEAAAQLKAEIDGDLTSQLPVSESDTREMPVDGEHTREMAVVSEDQTREMPKATVTDLEVTAQMPVTDDIVSDDTDLTETLPANDDDDTIQVPSDSGKKRRAKK